MGFKVILILGRVLLVLLHLILLKLHARHHEGTKSRLCLHLLWQLLTHLLWNLVLSLQLCHLVELEDLLLKLTDLGMHVVDIWIDWSSLKLLHLRRHLAHHWHLHATESTHHHWVVLLLLLLILKKLLALSVVHATSHSWVGLLQVFLELRAGALKVRKLGLLLCREFL